MKDATKKEERSKKKLKEVNEQELQRVMGGIGGCFDCVCGSGSSSGFSAQSSFCSC